MKLKRNVFFMVIVLFCLSSAAYPMMIANESCIIFPNQCDSDGESKARITDGLPKIGHLIAESAGFFLESNSYLQLLLSKVELAEINGIDYYATKNILKKAITKMEKSNISYMNLYLQALSTEYDDYVVMILEKFNYKRFELENRLNPTIFKKTKFYLSSADVRGIYCHLYSETFNILQQLHILNDQLESKNIPDVAYLWRINQTYAEVELFGQYVAEIFYKIKKQAQSRT
jgi:hypothetical protein